MSEPVVTSSSALTSIEQEDLRLLAGMMIPADRRVGILGADDPVIMADMIGSVGRDRIALKRILGIVRRSMEMSGAKAVNADELVSLWQGLREQDAGGLSALESVVVRAYYRDDRVLRSIGMEPRPPFPKGYVVEDGDWQLLEPVQARGRIWRQTSD